MVEGVVPVEGEHLILDEAAVRALRAATSAAMMPLCLEEVLVTILNACSEGLGCVYPCLALLDEWQDQLVGKVVSSSHTDDLIRRATANAGVRLDSFLGLRSERRGSVRRGARSTSVPSDAITYQRDETSNLVVRVFLEHRSYTTRAFYDLVRPSIQPYAAMAAQQALGVDSIVLLPLLAVERCLGVFTAAFAPGRSPTATDLLTLEFFVAQASIAIEHAHLRQELSDREERVSFLLKATIEAQEQERERICLEIHDGVAQTLAPAFHYLQVLANRRELPDDSLSILHKASVLVRKAVQEAREVVATLRPATLDTLGIVDTLHHEMGELRDQTGLQIKLDAERVRFPKAVETALYRIIKEAANNVIKHARAKHMVIRVKQDQSCILAEVQDDGVGFDIHALERDPHRKGVGLLSMRKRAELTQGRFWLTSNPREGTRVRVEIPLPAHE